MYVGTVDRPKLKLMSPHEWNSGAPSTIVELPRYGMAPKKATSGSRPSGSDRCAPLGRPVVPDVKMMTVPGLSGLAGCFFEWPSRMSATLGMSWSSSVQASSSWSSSTFSATGRNSSSRMMNFAPSRLASSVSWLPLAMVLRSSTRAPACMIAIIDITMYRWLRARSATESPCSTPRSFRARVSWLIWSRRSAQVISPRSSTIAVCFGKRAAAAATAAGNPGPHFTSWYPAIARRCGSCGFASPICRNTFRRYARSSTVHSCFAGSMTPEL